MVSNRSGQITYQQQRGPAGCGPVGFVRRRRPGSTQPRSNSGNKQDSGACSTISKGPVDEPLPPLRGRRSPWARAGPSDERGPRHTGAARKAGETRWHGIFGRSRALPRAPRSLPVRQTSTPPTPPAGPPHSSRAQPVPTIGISECAIPEGENVARQPSWPVRVSWRSYCCRAMPATIWPIPGQPARYWRIPAISGDTPPGG